MPGKVRICRRPLRPEGQHLTAIALPKRQMTTPVVSIGVPVFNGARFLRDALDSLLAQSLSDFELIISDNASTDSTESICREYAQRDARVRYHRQTENMGVAANWNFVVRQARGKYFKWSSANDRCAPQMLACCTAELEAEPRAVLCYGRTCLIDERTEMEERYPADFALLERRPHERFRELFRRLRLNNAQSGVIRTQALGRTGLEPPYPNGDLILMAELALQGCFLLLDDTMLYRRMGKGTFSGLLSPEELRDTFDPRRTGTSKFTYLRLHRDLLLAVVRAPIDLPEKLLTLGLAGRQAVSHRQRMWGEISELLFGKTA